MAGRWERGSYRGLLLLHDYADYAVADLAERGPYKWYARGEWSVR